MKQSYIVPIPWITLHHLHHRSSRRRRSLGTGSLNAKYLSQTQNIVTKINILLQEICDIKKQKLDKQIFNDHKNHPKDIGEGNGQDDTHWIYSNASDRPPLDIPNTPGHHVLSPNHTPNTDGNASALQKPIPYELWSASPPEWPSSSSSDEDSTDDNAGRVEYGLMKTALPLKRVGMGEGESEREGEREIRGRTEEGLPDPFSDAVTKTLGPESDPEPERRRGRGQPLDTGGRGGLTQGVN